MTRFVNCNSDSSEKKNDFNLLAFFYGSLFCFDCSEDFKGSVVRQECIIDKDSFVIDVLISSVEDVTSIFNMLVSQYQSLKSSDENSFLFDFKVFPVDSSFNVIFKIYSSIPF